MRLNKPGKHGLTENPACVSTGEDTPNRAMIGLPGKLNWRQEHGDLVMEVPAKMPDCEYAYVFRVPLM